VDSFIEDLNNDEEYDRLRGEYQKGLNTHKRMSDAGIGIDLYEFKELEKKIKKELFYNNLFSDTIPFTEIMHYFDYLNEEANYLTMHKTKGTGIKNVLVVLDEYFWSKYSFKDVFDISINSDRIAKSQKLLYVACSRAIQNLSCVKLIPPEEKDTITEAFKDFNIVEVQ
ncbi:MAG: hypothetical protein MI862_24545, partial [Desulfobacterales bacterium]|nr:hypothetical protein [Desulfobacterales bacterium]